MEPEGLEDRYKPDPVIKEMLDTSVLLPYSVLVPFADKIAENFPSEHLRARRNFKKFLNIVSAVAFLHQKQRPIVYREGMKAVNYVVALPVDFAMAWTVAEQGLREMLMGMQGRTLRILSLFEPGTWLTVKDVAKETGYSINRAREILNVLVYNRGVLDKDDSQKTHSYILSDNKRENNTITNFVAFSEYFGEKELKTYLDNRKMITRTGLKYRVTYTNPITVENIELPSPNGCLRVIENHLNNDEKQI